MSDNQYDDDIFHPWSITGLDQCGSERYIKNKKESESSDSFKMLIQIEDEESNENNEFVRIYVQEEESLQSEQSESGQYSDNDFSPFITGITKFDDMVASGKGSEYKQKELRLNEQQSLSVTQPSDDALSQIEQTDQNNGESVELNDSASVVDKEELKRVFEDAYKNGFEEGSAKGYEEGKLKGYEEGLAQGMEEGFKTGHEKGEHEGYDTGFQKGEQEGYDAGFQKGEEDGKVAGDATALEIITSLEDILNKAEQSWQNSIKAHESKILSLICKITEKVVYAKLELDEGIVKESILDALSTIPEPEEITLNISPDDYEYVEVIKDDFFEQIKSLKSVNVISNPSVQRGGCRIESSKGKVETDIQTRLEQVFTSVMGARVA